MSGQPDGTEWAWTAFAIGCLFLAIWSATGGLPVVIPEAVLAVLLALPTWQGDRDDTEAARRALLEPVAVAIAASSEEPRVVAAVVTQGLRESRYARYVIENRCHEGPVGARCDEDECGNPRARGPWQLWRVACPSAYEYGAGTQESLLEEARCIARLWRGGLRRCQGLHPAGDVAGAFAALRGGASCQSRTAGARAAEHERVMGMLFREMGDR